MRPLASSLSAASGALALVAAMIGQDMAGPWPDPGPGQAAESSTIAS